MADTIRCPSCQRQLQLPEALMGHDVQCPGCGATFTAKTGRQAPPSSRPLELPPDPYSRDLDEDRPRKGRRDDDDDDEGDDFDGQDVRQRRDLLPHRGNMVLILGVVGLFFPFLAPVAWILGNSDLAAMKAGRMDPDGEGMTQGGMVCGIIGSVLLGFMLCCCGLSFMGIRGL